MEDDKFDVTWSALFEIYSVNIYIDAFDDVSSTEIEGKFEVFDVDMKYIDCYNAAEGVLPDGTLSLSGPFRCLEGYDFGFRIYLKEKHQNLEISNGYHVQGLSDSDSYKSEPLRAVVSGKDGYAIVNYILFQKASQATIEVFLNTCGSNQENISRIHGVIHAKHDVHKFGNVYDEKYFKSCLFNASEEKSKKLNSGNNGISLSRSKFAAPMGGKLIIEADLLQGKSVLAQGSISFETQLYGATQKSIGGVIVKVTWAGDPFKAAGLPNPLAYTGLPKGVLGWRERKERKSEGDNILSGQQNGMRGLK